MIEKLQGIKQRFDFLSEKLAAPDAMDNREVVLPGLICGIIGYAIGNYLGIGIAIALKLVGG